MNVRAATPADKEAVLGFCRHTFEWGDYLPEVWDRWLGDQSSTLMVGEVDGKPVAVGNVRLVTPDEAWLQGLRIDPAHRGTGLAHSFTVDATRAAAALGARVVRLMTMPATVAIHKVMDELGYRRIAAFTCYEADAAKLPADPYDVLDAGDLESAYRFIETSRAFSAMGRLRCVDWVCDELKRSKLLGRFERGDVWARRSGLSIEALMIVHRSSDEDFQIEFADGEQSALTALATAARERAAGNGAGLLRACLPNLRYLLGAFEAAGYGGEGHEFWIFEKQISNDHRSHMTST